MTKLR